MSQVKVENCFPSFTYFDASNDMDLDFNMLSEYLLVDEDPMKSNMNWQVSSSEDIHADNKGSAVVSEHESSDDDEHDGKRQKLQDKTGKNKDQVDRRRERNRVLARKTRLRKKFFFESLQKQVSQLASENEQLKNVVRQKMQGEIRTKILSECKSVELPPIVANVATTATAILEKSDFSLIKAIQAAQRSFVITDPSLPDNPIIFASKGFLDLCGYQLEEVLGRNCRFLQGPNTDPKQVEVLREGILAGRDTSVCLLNYRADGSQFYNQIFIAALRNSANKIINYVGVQVEIKSPKIDASSATAAASVTSTSSSSTASAAFLRDKKKTAKVARPDNVSVDNPIEESSASTK